MNRGGKEFTDECSHYWPSSIAGTQAKRGKTQTKTPVWRWNCFFLLSLPQAHPQAHTESLLSSWSLFLQKPPTLCSTYPRFSMHALCSYLQECIHRSLLSITWTSITHSCHSRQDENTATDSTIDPLVAVADEEGRQVEDIGESAQSRISSLDNFSESLLFLQLYSSSNFPILSKWNK